MEASMENRFDLEENIMSAWSSKEDIDLVLENVLEKDLTKDEIANALMGISSLHQMRCEKLFDTFTAMIAQKQFVIDRPEVPTFSLADVEEWNGEINLNAQVGFVLTPFGQQKMREFYASYNMPQPDVEGEKVMSLWEFMQIFGKHMWHGMPEVITEGNKFKLMEVE